MKNEAIQYLEFHRAFTIEIDANNLVDTAIKALNFIRESIKDLSVPEVLFNTNEIEYLQVDISWDRNEHHLDIEILDGRSNAFVYYINSVTREQLNKWYRLDEPLPNWLINKLSLFTE